MKICDAGMGEFGLELCVSTFFWWLQLSTLCDLHDGGRLVPSAFRHVLNLLNDVVALKNLAKNNVLAVEPTAIRY